MTLAYRHIFPLVSSLIALSSFAGCDGSGESGAAGNTQTGAAGSGGSTGTGTGTGGDGGLFQTANGGSTGSGTTSSSTPDPSAGCVSPTANTQMSVWTKKAGAAEVQSTLGLASDNQGAVVVAGNFLGSIDFGTGVLTSSGQNDAYVAKLDANGTALWAKKYGDAQYHQYAQHVATDAQGNIFVTGHFRGTINFGGANLNDVYNFFEDLFVAKLDTNGGHLWSKRAGDINNEESQAIATDKSGNVLVVGAFQKSIDFGGGAVVAEDGGFNAFVVKLSALGDQQWAKSFGDTANEQKAIGVTADADGNVYITGYHRGSIDFGGGMLTAPDTKQHAYLAKLSSTGNYVWAKSWPTDTGSGVDVAVDSAGDVFVTGNFKGAGNFGGKDFDASVANDVFLVKLASDGTHIWSKTFGTKSAADEVSAMRLQGLNPVLLGGFTNKINFGGGDLTSAGGFDVYLAKLDTDGCQIHSAVFGAAMLQRGETLAIDPTGNTLFGGSFDSTVDFGTGPVTADGTDAYVVKSKP
ncbi:MAG: hypothetical protein IPK82_39605 [Polyangiaceae bacterium]|nr:hypothetical protein [Polyangiaceae bacterium]